MSEIRVLSWRPICNPRGGKSDRVRLDTGQRIIAAWFEIWKENEKNGVSGEQQCQAEIPDYLIDLFEEIGMSDLVSYINSAYGGPKAPSAVFDDDSKVIRISWVQ